MCRSRRSSCVPTTDSWGWSVVLFYFIVTLSNFALTSLNAYGTLKYCTQPFTGIISNRPQGGSMSQILSMAEKRDSVSSCRREKVPIVIISHFFRALHWCDSSSCGHSDQPSCQCVLPSFQSMHLRHFFLKCNPLCCVHVTSKPKQYIRVLFILDLIGDSRRRHFTVQLWPKINCKARATAREEKSEEHPTTCIVQ